MGDGEATPKLSLGLTTGLPFEWACWAAENVERLGFQALWIGEDIGRPNNVFVLTMLAALATRQLPVGVGITPPILRNITTLARAAITLQQASKGRFRLGIGVGGLQDLARLSLRVDRPARLMEEAVTVLRRIWLETRVDFEGEYFTLRGFKPAFRAKPPPIFFGVRGLRLLKLAGQLADGAIISGPINYLKQAVSAVREGLSNRRAPLHGRFHIVVWIPTLLLQDAGGLELARRVAAIVASDTPDQVLKLAGVSLSLVEPVRQALRSRGVKEASRHVDDKLLNEFVAYGNAETLCRKLRSLRSLGVDEVVFGPPYGAEWRTAVEKVAEAWHG